MTALWTSAEAVTATGGVCLSDWAASGVSIDTRTITSGDLFVALQDVRDGHDFVAQALENGAVAALVSRIPDGLENAPLLLVPDVLKGLEALALAARNRAVKLIAVTGSVGKTGTKEMLRTALGNQGQVHGAEKSYNNHWGVPLTMARMPHGTDFAIIEIGMNHAGEIGPLSKIAQPDVAIITNVAPVHMVAFDSLAQIAAEKAAVVAGMSGGVLVLNADSDTLGIQQAAAASQGVDTMLFGVSQASDFRLLDASVADGITDVNAMINGRTLAFRIGGAGRHLAMNGLAALAAVQAIGADVAMAAKALLNWHPPAGRGARWQIGQMCLIDDSYNANPLSVGVALDVLAASNGRKVAILGDMLELGADEHALHRELVRNSSVSHIATVHCVGPLMKSLFLALPSEKRGIWVETSAELAPQLAELLAGVDAVMVKGSLGAKMGLIVDAIKELGDATPLDKTGDI